MAGTGSRVALESDIDLAQKALAESISSKKPVPKKKKKTTTKKPKKNSSGTTTAKKAKAVAELAAANRQKLPWR